MTHLRTRALPGLSVALLLVAALVSAAATWFGTAGWSPASVRATAEVDIAPLIGTYSNYEVVTHAADFATAYDGGRSSGDAPADPDSAGAFVDSSRVSDSTLIRVTYVADSRKEAEDGLRRQVRRALDSMAEGMEQQLDSELAGAKLAQESLEEQSRKAILEGVPETAATASVTRAGELVADASSALRSVQVAAKGNTDRAESLRVDAEPLSSTDARIRASLVAALTALFLVGGVLVVLRTRSSRHHTPRTDGPGHDPTSP
ncbi:hypothetical protein [Janibacter sp. GS2]|uniref:hypothetical protein n=1 Tax=Janibacter sp. GS2 TaxID=3442646 RepID=UPI003EBB904B